MPTIEEEVEKLKRGEITPEQLRDIVLKEGYEVAFWNPTKERHPLYPEGDNRSRCLGFTYNPHYHPKGKFFQWVMKPLILRIVDFAYGTALACYGEKKGTWLQRALLKIMLAFVPNAVDFAHNAMTAQYDPDAFVFDDPRLKVLRELMFEHIDKNFKHDYPRKATFMKKSVDMGLVILKEDIYYRGRALLILNDLIARYPGGFQLVEPEIKNIEQNR